MLSGAVPQDGPHIDELQNSGAAVTRRTAVENMRRFFTRCWPQRQLCHGLNVSYASIHGLSVSYAVAAYT